MFNIRFMIALLLHTSARAQSPYVMVVAIIRLSKSRIIPEMKMYFKTLWSTAPCPLLKSVICVKKILPQYVKLFQFRETLIRNCRARGRYVGYALHCTIRKRG